MIRRNRIVCLVSASAIAAVLAAVLLPGCSLVATRPAQEMADASAAIKAAREVGAHDRVPELYQQAVETFTKATAEYRFKNFQQARELTIKARRYAEEAEFEAIRAGAERNPELNNVDPAIGDHQFTPDPVSPPDEYATPTGTPADDYEARKKAEDAASNNGNRTTVPVPAPNSLPNN